VLLLSVAILSQNSGAALVVLIIAGTVLYSIRNVDWEWKKSLLLLAGVILLLVIVIALLVLRG
jgi:hypothetical protein